MKCQRSVGLERITGFFYVPQRIEQSFSKAIESSSGGVFIGSSFVYSMPFFVDFDALINPHMFILGMSGGGKTFLMKNLLLKIHAVLESTLVVIDFTGEYEMASELQTREEREALDPISYMEEGGHRVLYFNLKSLSEKEKVNAASNVLQEVVKVMRSRPLDSKERIFVLLDEAWKLLKDNADLKIMIREGRKYKLGLILASQLIEDLELPMLASSASLFVFRVQNKKSLEKLSKNYGFGEKTISTIQNLEVGSCLAIQIYKSGMREAMVVRRVLGVSMKKYIGIAFGDIVVEIDEEELAAVIRRLCEKDPSTLISEISDGRSIELESLIRRLMLFGADRRAILNSMRGLGIEDYEIADAFALAVEQMGETNERQLPA
jgi:DNA helicase HerA-like ATPase